MQGGGGDTTRKRHRPSADVLDMPGEFPSRQKVNRMQKTLETTQFGDSAGSWLLSYLLTPLRVAREWLAGDEQQVRPPPPAAAALPATPTANVTKQSTGHAELRSVQNRRRRHRRRKPVTSRDKESYRKSLFGSGISAGEGARRNRNRNNSLVREYTLPAYNYQRMQAEYMPIDNDNDNDDAASVLTIDSSIAYSRRDRQYSFAESEATTTTTEVSFATRRKGRPLKSEADDWISQLRRKIQETLSVSGPSTAHVLTPAYDRVCKEESDIDARLEKARQEMAFRLPADAQRVIKMANSSGFTTEVNNVPVSSHDIATLGDGEWLNDEVINFYMQLLILRSEQLNQKLPKVHAFNTFFYSTLEKGGYARVRRWTRRIALFEKDIIIIPVHLGVHWCCAVIDFRHKSIKYYDALHGSNREALHMLMDYLHEESRDKLKTEFDDSGWTMGCDKDIPRQLNGYDCGVFAITFAEYAARDAPFAFSQKNCQFLRKKVTYEIATQSLLSTAA
ncbi:hypothetical protein EV175_005419 [Coemansia sp. RSA 1933]|nr:hypothetical protein EV175_005419 [Coemansia sp. RSA 1933]